ncbi:MAG TPA: undecaprenyl-diphosphate phosphatase [Actinomycetota bacterium]|nr:undecaprenyl-diphosphate phosphatase [Actinomycetota bacterium]
MLRAIVLGIVQGITEFLPISSSAHLSIVPRLLGFATPTLAFEVLLHFGTLAAVAAYFARDLWAFVLCLVAPGRLGPEEAATRRRLLGLLALASVPAAAVGFVLQDWADEQTARPLRASVWLVLTTVIMIAAELYDRARSRRVAPVAAAGPGAGAGTRAERFGRGTPAAPPDPADAEEELKRLPVAKAAGIGLAQALALVPGTSRSGVTISAGLFQGVSRGTAARFSFLLSIPAILGAGILKLDELSGATETPAELVAGTVAAGVSGFLAVSFLIRLLRTRTLWPFIWYRLIAGGLFVLLLSTVRS